MAIHYLGIRHHGAGSAARVVAALEALQPDCVLIEGPADCSELLPLLASPNMRTPVSLLAYAAEWPECHLYYPFADYSPEYQAACWAVRNGATAAFIDIPINIKMAGELARRAETAPEPSAGEDRKEEPEPDEAQLMRADPFGALAELAGYQDGESWWNDFIEQSQTDSETIFATISDLMSELRAAFPDEDDDNVPLEKTNRGREAFMRLQIADYAKSANTVAVICGAWHAPALQEKHALKDDKALLKALPKKLPASKIKATWVPWTSNRLSQASGYGAGVAAPMWYQHLWQYRADPAKMELWFGVIARALREAGQVVSTASIIEAVRLSQSLAAVRKRPSAGFEEIIDSVVSCLCFGEKMIWDTVAQQLLLGSEVGAIPPETPLAPLLEDLQQQQKLCKLKPEALSRELAIDLRTESGNRRSLLLHRLTILGVPWGELSDVGNSRGTFREKWLLEWRPEYSVQLVENLVYGNSIEQAANQKTIETMRERPPLDTLAQQVKLSLVAQLKEAAEEGLALLDDSASQTDNAAILLGALPPLIHVGRYGTARVMNLGHLQQLIERLTIQTALALPVACRNLNADEAEHYRQRLQAGHAALLLAELPEDVMATWWTALRQIIDARNSNLLIAGLATRLLYQAEQLTADEVQAYLQRILSPAIPSLNAAQYFDGFFSQAIQMLQYDKALLATVEAWLLALEEEDFIQQLPLLKRIFSTLDRTERQRLLQTVLATRPQSALAFTEQDSLQPLWQDQLSALSDLFSEPSS